MPVDNVIILPGKWTNGEKSMRSPSTIQLLAQNKFVNKKMLAS